ncbi:TPA: BspA family leucine-rich repeat surface protein [Enterococcus faecium]
MLKLKVSLLTSLLILSTSFPGMASALSVEPVSQSDPNSGSLKQNNSIEATKYNDTVANIASGIIGTSNWVIDSNGTLHISTGNFGGTNPGGGGHSPWYSYRNQITSIVFDGPVKNSGGQYENLFSSLSSVSRIIGINQLDTSGVTSLYGMFSGMSSIQTLDLSTFDTSSVTNMNGMFLGDTLLEAVNVSSFDTSNMDQLIQYIF